MLTLISRILVIFLALTSSAMAQQCIIIAPDWGEVAADLVDNEATRALIRMLPLTIDMRDHLRQERGHPVVHERRRHVKDLPIGQIIHVIGGHILRVRVLAGDQLESDGPNGEHVGRGRQAFALTNLS